MYIQYIEGIYVHSSSTIVIVTVVFLVVTQAGNEVALIASLNVLFDSNNSSSNKSTQNLASVSPFANIAW